MRRYTYLNEGWKFVKEDVGADNVLGAEGVNVNVPHTWNNVDGQDGGDDYYRGRCWYTRNFAKPAFSDDERVYLEFEGVNASAQVYVNGKEVMTHDGGYSTFRADITNVLNDDNVLIVSADNSVNERVYPQTADFTFYGGIYRDVKLVVVNKKHFDMDYYGGTGIQITPSVTDGDGYVTVIAYHRTNAEVYVKICDATGGMVADGRDLEPMCVKNVHLWHGVEDPYLYTVYAYLIVNNEVVDEVKTRIGFRTFSVDPKKGFFLNGKKYPLHGVSRHQDRKGLGNALTKEHHKEDMELIAEIGANTIRLAHYQHDQYFYDLCDEYGMIVWAEIPYISRHMPEGRENTINQMKELITQNYNHPSIVTWGVSNEITMFGKHRKDMLDNHRALIDLCKIMDPTRPTTLANFAMCGPFNKVAHMTDIVSWNLYLGWYVPGLFLNDLWMDFFHFCYPKRCLGYSEYGCEGMPNLHSLTPRRGDHTEEYQAKYHEYLLKCFERHEYLWSTHVWNMFDFAADARDQGGEPGMNHKGLMTFDRKIKKDSFYLYKAYWSNRPFVHICSKRFENRTGNTLKIKVYTNQTSVSLYHNGELVENKVGNYVFNFTVPMENVNAIEVRSGELSDSATFVKVDKKDQSYILKVKSNNASWEKKKD